ncbi:glycine betaine--corrinoid protein methyltransferase [Desulfitobacterium dehalogenans]|uniref:glycine betaine--corrinoid protein methyltransferase n=1 Tax=Desulfitobacterium dehalogenans TaxID=36854 RepID=UPI0011D2BFAA|nr:glycine betaine--corrinoid protein methyltransferase [Desulfitobacterium dehalogenans]
MGQLLPKYNILTEDQVQKIHENTMKILEEIGIEFEYEPALEVFRREGQKVEGKRVYLTREFVESKLKSAPAEFILHARNPENNVVIGGDNIVFMPGYGAPFIYELDGSRRKTTLQDYENFAKLAGASKNMHLSGGTMAEPQDIPDGIRHLKMLYSSIKNSDKCFMGSAEGRKRAEDSIEMAAILFGGKDVIKEKPVLVSLINSLTPLKYDERMLGALMAYAEAGQAVVIASLVMAGSTGPASLAGTLSLQNAEVLAGISLAQSINPGTPVIYGSTSALSDMRSGSLSIGSPECALFISASAQLARYYGVPSRSGGGLNDSKAVDAQAGYESMMTLMATTLTGINFVLHTAGILQYFMAMSYEKFIMDDELAGMLLHYMKGYTFDEDGMAYDVIAKVGPGGHFLTQKHTRKNHKREFYTPTLSDRNAYDGWAKDKLEAKQRAHARWQQILANYVPPALDQEIDAKLQAFIAQRSEVLGGE